MLTGATDELILSSRLHAPPQTRHSATKRETENGGILRLSANGVYVAKTADFAALRKTNVS